MELKSVVQVCRERKEGKDPDMSVLLGLRCEFTLFLLVVITVVRFYRAKGRISYDQSCTLRLWISYYGVQGDCNFSCKYVDEIPFFDLLGSNFHYAVQGGLMFVC